ncbi:MAG TPA: glycoside hydrolase family 9 protein [Chitinophagaceae bacterium]|nr:glycoside hydrolase family 9 protein [Chitinophagaceae bacterium]
MFKPFTWLVVLLACNGCFSQQTAPPAIQLNQEGFYTGAAKIAIVTGDVAAKEFSVIAVTGNDTVFKGSLGPPQRSSFSSVVTKLADLSALKQPGRYVVFVPGVGRSHPFAVDDQVHHRVAVASLKGFYFIRSNVSLEEQYAGKWKRGSGHPDTLVYVHASAADARRPAGSTISSAGGWYDAGDYNKYIVNSGITMATLTGAYEDFTTYFDQLKTGIPSHAGLPDVLTEIVYNLRWMLTMQDPADGGVYHKCTNANFDGMVMPGATKDKRYVVQKSTAAALNLAAVTAQAARVLRRYNKELPGLADSCLRASALAWKWAVANPAVVYSQRTINAAFDPDISTGEYGDRSFSDEWLWAAAELFAATKSKVYYDTVAARIKDGVSVPSWNTVGLLGYYTFIRHQQQLPSYASGVVKQMKDTILKMADGMMSKMPANAFRTVMGQSRRDFIWGSNAVAANQGMLLVMAYLISKNTTYLNGALSNLDYILGRNATGYCFVTGIGTRSPMHPHHRPSEADGIAEPVPGLLAGGPNPARQDGCNYHYTEAETAYVDDVCSYASNEIAINWNAPLVYLANALEALL